MNQDFEPPRGINRFLPSSMRYGHFRYYWLSLLVGVTGQQMLFSFTLGWLMFDITGQERDLAFLGIAIAAPALALNVFGGALADRFEPKYIVAPAQAASATLVAILAVLVLMEKVEPWHLLAMAVAIGTVQAFDRPSRASIYPRLVERQHIANAVAVSELIWNGVRVLGPALAGLLIEGVSIHAAIFFSAATFYIQAMVVSLLRLRPRAPATGQVAQQIREGVRYVLDHPVFSYIMLLTFCNSMFGMSYVHLMPSFANEVLNVGADKVGFLLGASGVGGFIGTVIIANVKDYYPKGLIVVGAAIFYGCALILFALATSQGLYLVSMGLLVFVGIANSIYLVGGISTIQQLVPDRLRGRIMGLYGPTWSMAPLGMAQAGFIAEFYGASVAVAAGGIVIVLVAFFVYLRSADIRALRAVIPEQLQVAPSGSGDAG